MAEKTVSEINSGGRKDRTRNPRPKKQYVDKDPAGLNFAIPCEHKSEKTKFKCSSLSVNAILANRRKFYSNPNKIQQNVFLSRLLSTYEPERRNKIPPKGTKNRTLSCAYHLLTHKNKAVPVCKQLFLAAFSVSEKRLRTLNKTLMKGSVPKENRGGDHRSHKSVVKKNKLRDFLNNLPAKESHYSRTKSKRIYLSSDLNARKLLKYYNVSVSDECKVKPAMFYKIFHGEFNIGFSTPASDSCSTCILLINKIKNEKDPTKKVELMTQKRIHKLRANAFYEAMKTSVLQSISLCFDLQQVLPLPRTPIQDSFYARQVSLYNFCIVNLNNNKPTFYVWDETQANRGSVEVGSALYSYLSNLDIPNDTKVLRLFCDGCGGQNKNSHIIQSLIQWLYSKSSMNLLSIEITFPVRGHSFLPADRVFGRIEKDLRKSPIITTKEEYFEIINQHGDLHSLNEDWNIKDIKSLSNIFKKVENIQSLKRIHITKKIKQGTNTVLNCLITKYENFRFESGNEKNDSLLKHNKRIPLEIPTIACTKIPLSVNKKKDVENLLKKQFGDDWRTLEELAWYKTIIDDHQPRRLEEASDECDCVEMDCDEIRV